MIGNRLIARLAAAVVAVATANAGDFDLTWFTIDGGGGYSAGAAFELEGTIGQPDASYALTGGGFELTGGFWAGAGAAAPCLGDLDGDGQIALSDLAIVLSNFGTPSGATPEQGDLDGDGDVDLTDLATMLSLFGTACA